MVQRVICVKNVKHGFHPSPDFNVKETEAPRVSGSSCRADPGSRSPAFVFLSQPPPAGFMALPTSCVCPLGGGLSRTSPGGRGLLGAQEETQPGHTSLWVRGLVLRGGPHPVLTPPPGVRALGQIGRAHV